MNFVRSKYFIAITILVVVGVSLSLYFYLRKTPVVVPEEVVVEDVKKTYPIKEIIGYSVEGRKIESFTYGSGKYNLVFVGGIHGGYEWNTVILAEQFIDYINKNQSIIPDNVTVTVIPSLNPDGVYKVVGKEGAFSANEVSKNTEVLASGRFNANNVDLNRNFDCKWKPEAVWRSKPVSAGTSVFSEPEALAIKNFVSKKNPSAVIFWHSQSNAVYASACNNGILPETLDVMNAYSKASGYAAVKSFNSYAITGDSGDWLATLGIPSISVELKTHETIELNQNILGVKALFDYYSNKV